MSGQLAIKELEAQRDAAIAALRDIADRVSSPGHLEWARANKCECVSCTARAAIRQLSKMWRAAS